MDELDAANVQTACGLVEHEERRVALEFAGDDQLLLVPARKGLGRYLRRRSADVVGTDLLPCRGQDRAAIPERAPRVRSLVVAREHQVVGQREGKNEPESVSIRRDVADVGLVDGARRHPGDVTPAKIDPPGRHLAEAYERFHELVLAVAGDTGDPEDLAGAYLQIDTAHHLVAAVVLHVQVVDLEAHLAWV